jgi:hypothetical protein
MKVAAMFKDGVPTGDIGEEESLISAVGCI